MKDSAAIKLPHDDISVIPFAWTWAQYLILAVAVIAAVIVIAFIANAIMKWTKSRHKKSLSPLKVLHLEAKKLAVESSSAVDFSGLYTELSRLLRSGIDYSYKTSFLAWNFSEITNQSDLLKRYVGESTHQVLGFLGRADRCIYSGEQVDITIFSRDRNLVIHELARLCEREQNLLEGKK